MKTTSFLLLNVIATLAALPLHAQDLVNPCAVTGVVENCTGPGLSPSNVRIDGIEASPAADAENVIWCKPGERIVFTPDVAYSKQAKGARTTYFSGECNPRVETNRLKPTLEITATAKIGDGPVLVTNGTSIEVSAPQSAGTHNTRIGFAIHASACVTGGPADLAFTNSYTLEVESGFGISAVSTAGEMIESGDYISKNQALELVLTANLGGILPPGYDLTQLQWSSTPEAAGKFISSGGVADRGNGVRWKQNAGYVSAAEDDVAITATATGYGSATITFTVLSLASASGTLLVNSTNDVLFWSDYRPKVTRQKPLEAFVTKLNASKRTLRQYVEVDLENAGASAKILMQPQLPEPNQMVQDMTFVAVPNGKYYDIKFRCSSGPMTGDVWVVFDESAAGEAFRHVEHMTVLTQDECSNEPFIVGPDYAAVWGEIILKSFLASPPEKLIWDCIAKPPDASQPLRGITVGAPDDPSEAEFAGDKPGEFVFRARCGSLYGLHKVKVLDMAIVPDFDRDGAIDGKDRERAVQSNAVFRFWINDDDDSGNDGGDNSPDRGVSADWRDAGAMNYTVDGRSDLADFAPLWINLKPLLEELPAERGYKYILKQADGALQFVYTDLSRLGTRRYLISDIRVGENLEEDAREAKVMSIDQDGIELSGQFLQRAKEDPNKGVILVEGAKVSASPLAFVIQDADGRTVVSNSLRLSISPVEDMYRKVNLRDLATPLLQPEPRNYPDSLADGKNLIFLHGFNVSEEDARGWHAEMFKRLYWSGSRAMFHAVTWQGDEGVPAGLNFAENVINAFQASPHLASYVNKIAGKRNIMAHSLGNMAVSCAIQDHKMEVNRYFLLNAAVAEECYRPAAFKTTTRDNHMVPDSWSGYKSNTWCSTWHQLFSAPDDRAKLTWKNRFPAAMAISYNFYSSGDELFEIYPGTPGPLTDISDSLGRYAWQKQELFKGGDMLGGTDWAGWGFAGQWVSQPMGPPRWERIYDQDEANNASNVQLRDEPVFRRAPGDMLTASITKERQDEILAKGIPALSSATGGRRLDVNGVYNFNMDASKPGGWGRTGGAYGTRWLHSDAKDMAYFYTYIAFDQIALVGDLR